MNNEELLEEARAYFAQLEKPNEEPDVTYISDYTLHNKEDKENLNKMVIEYCLLTKLMERNLLSYSFPIWNTTALN